MQRIEVGAQTDARKNTLKQADALALLREVDQLYASQGKTVVHVDLRKGQPDEAALLALGPTGNPRAPSLRKGRTLIVGFDEVTYRTLLR